MTREEWEERCLWANIRAEEEGTLPANAMPDDYDFAVESNLSAAEIEEMDSQTWNGVE